MDEIINVYVKKLDTIICFLQKTHLIDKTNITIFAC